MSDAPIRAYAPATIANLGPGFDVIGLALSAPGDIVEARLRPEGGGVIIEDIEGDGGALPREAARNTAGVAAQQLLERAGRGAPPGVVLRVQKGLPLGSGLGSSAASAAAAAIAVNALLDEPLGNAALLDACRAAEAVACGTPHADNVAPALFGGIVLLPPREPIRPVPLPIPPTLWCALARPDIRIRTEDARRVLPETVPLADAVGNVGRFGLFISALHRGDLADLGEAASCGLITPHRKALIPGYDEATTAAMGAGALGAGIAGSGPTIFAFADGEVAAQRVSSAMVEAFVHVGIEATAWASAVDARGARILGPEPDKG